MTEKPGVPGISQEQLLYARILAAGMYAGLATLLLTFALYLSGVVEPAIPIDALPRYWSMSVDEYLAAVNSEYLHRDHSLTGWWWLTALGKGDYLSFVGITVLSTVTMVCFIGITPLLLRQHDWIYAAIAVTEVLILGLAASGVLTAGH